MNKSINNNFREGLKDGIPIFLAYISVSFAFGLSAKEKGLPIWIGVLMSATNLTSAGQFAGLEVIASLGAVLELAITTLIINLRYFLMSFTLSQKIDEGMPSSKRMFLSFGITDEIFAVITRKENKVGFLYFSGLILLPYIGWSLGTFMGAGASMLLPLSLRTALSVAIYGMFIAIIIPPSKKNHKFFYAALIGAGISAMFKYIPFINKLSGGWVIIIATLVSASLCAYLFPIKYNEN